MENIKRSSHGIVSLPPSNAGRNTNTLGHWIWKFRLEVGIETFRHPIKGIPSFSKAFHKSPARFSTEVCDRRAERGEDAPTLAPPRKGVRVDVWRERGVRGGNRVGESRAVRSLNSLQPLVRALPRHSPPLSLVEGQSINILMGLNCRFYPSNDGGSSSIRSAEPPIASLYLFSLPSFAHPASAPFRQISRIRKNVKKKKKEKTVFTRLSALPRAP